MNNLDPVVVAATIASILFSPELAAVAGPYAVIIASSIVGAAWALGRRDSSSKLGAGGFMLRIVGTSMLVTVGVTKLIGWGMGVDDPTWLLTPVALVVGGIGDDWPRLGRWLILCIGRVFERRAGG